jgi:hypothetical protein
MPYIRQDQADIRVSVDGQPFGEAWFSVEGGNLASDESKTRPGGMGSEVSLGGPSSRDDVTVQIQLSDIVIGWHKTLEAKVQQDAPVKVAYTFLNRLKQPTGASHTVTGTLKSAFLPDMDGGSSDPAMYTIIVGADEQAA